MEEVPIEEQAEEGRFVSAPWYDRVFAVVCLPFWIVYSVYKSSADLSSGVEFLYGLGGLIPLLVYIHLSRYKKRNAPVRTLIVGGILTAGVLTALIWGCLPMVVDLEPHNMSKGEAIFLTAFGVPFVWLYFRDMQIALGVSQRDLVAERLAERSKKPRVPERNCVDCGMTLRVGRPRCHFCGGLPAQKAQSV